MSQRLAEPRRNPVSGIMIDLEEDQDPPGIATQAVDFPILYVYCESSWVTKGDSSFNCSIGNKGASFGGSNYTSRYST